MSELTCYVNGVYVPAEQAALPMNDLGIVRGYGVFDLLRTYGYSPFRLRDHLLRLQRSATAIGIALPWSLGDLERIVLDTYARNRVADASIRIVVTGGPSSNMMTPQNNPSLVVMVQPIAPSPVRCYTHGCKATTTRIERIMPTVKSLNYIGAIMAVSEAGKSGAVEAIYRDAYDHLTEGTRANFFVFKGNHLITPGEGILQGITRQAVLEAAPPEFDVIEAPIPYADLATVDEAFLTSTTKEVLPVVQVDDIRIGSGEVGPRTQRVMQLFANYARAVGQPVTA
ncbi:MAG: aminotransferase class IV [Caldilineaceae bacterium]|nr:aminotransferase class IV [Caldilineaceae bacterium]